MYACMYIGTKWRQRGAAGSYKALSAPGEKRPGSDGDEGNNSEKYSLEWLYIMYILGS